MKSALLQTVKPGKLPVILFRLSTDSAPQHKAAAFLPPYLVLCRADKLDVTNVVMIMGELISKLSVACAVRSLRIKPELSNTRRHAGFGATYQCWEPQLDRLLHKDQPAPTRCLLMDNRGVGKSGSPSRKSAYRTTVMAADVLALMVSLLAD